MSFLRPPTQRLVTVYHDPGIWKEPRGVFRALAHLSDPSALFLRHLLPPGVGPIEAWRIEVKPGHRQDVVVRPGDFHTCADAQRRYPPPLKYGFADEVWRGRLTRRTGYPVPPTFTPIITDDGEEEPS